MSLIRTIETLQDFAPKIHGESDFTIFLPYIQDAENEHIIPSISQDYYDELIGKLDGDGVSGVERNLLEKLQKAITYYALYESADFMNLPVGNSGMKEHNGEQEQAPRQWVFYNFKASSIRKADKALDDALKYMEVNKASFATWAGSDAFTVYKELFIENADVFGKYRNIGGSRSTYMMLRPFIDMCEHRYIKIAIGTELFTTLKANTLAGTLTTEQNTLLQYIRRALANYALYEGMPELILDITTSGIHVVSRADGITSKISASDTKLGQYREQVFAHAQTFYAEMKKFLDDNAADYPDYLASLAAENKTPNYDLHDNTDSKSVMI